MQQIEKMSHGESSILGMVGSGVKLVSARDRREIPHFADSVRNNGHAKVDDLENMGKCGER
jgi:hypothetical protein